jgi:tetratricopeptide (TPR) repeat protein
MTQDSTKAVAVFYSYAHRDEKLRNALVEHLSTLRRQGYISEWYDRQIMAGTDWAQEIDAHLSSASLILLLISPSFIASDYCYGIEMKLALERHQAGQALVVPIILRPTDLKETPFAALQYLPSGGKAITTWQNRDEAFLDVARGIRTVIENLTSSAASTQLLVQTLAQPVWNVPYPRNPLFTGREHILERLATMFHTGNTSESTQPLAISGLGGIGKTQTAIEYAYRYREQYRQVLWARADSRENLIQDYVSIAGLLQLPVQHLQDQPQIVEGVKRWLREQRHWLLILDNDDDLGMVRDFLPETSTGHVLLTTRAQAVGRLARRIGLDRMEQEEGALFLLQRAGILDAEESLDKASSHDQRNALAIVQEMDGLPLALDQAGAYVEETGCGLSGYLTRYQQRQIDLLNKRGEYTFDYPESVATTWSLAFEKVEQQSLAAADLLRLCAFLAPDTIPEEIITEGAADLTSELQSLASDPFLLDGAIKTLLRYSLIKRNAEEKLLSLHRLVQVVLKDAMSEETQHEWAERTVRAVNHAFPEVEFESWERFWKYLPHALACAVLIEQHHFAFQKAAELLHRVGWYLVDLAQYDQAESILQRALRISEQAVGPEHLDTAHTLHTLAWLYQDRGKYAEAEPLYQRALRIREQQLSPDHPLVAYPLTGLAGVYHQHGKYGEAESLYQRALRIREQALEAEHSDTAETLQALADLYQDQGKYVEAEPFYQRALAIREQTVVPDHLSIELTLERYAKLLRLMQHSEEAAQLEERASEIRTRRSSQKPPPSD